jgi:hypothetical protein
MNSSNRSDTAKIMASGGAVHRWSTACGAIWNPTGIPAIQFVSAMWLNVMVEAYPRRYALILCFSRDRRRR